MLTLVNVVACFVLVAVPGDSVRETPSASGFAYFGWPYVHYILYERKPNITGFTTTLDQTVQDRLLRETRNGFRLLVPAFRGETNIDDRFWSDPKNWSYVRPNSAGRTLWGGLGVNFCLAFAVSTGLSALYEIRRRRRKRVLQFTMLDLLLCVLVIGLTLGVSRFGSRQLERDQLLLGELRERYPDVVEVRGVFRPERLWMSRLADHRLGELGRWSWDSGLTGIMEIFRHPQPVSDLSVRGTRPHGDRLNFDPRNLAREINRFRDLDSLTLVSLDSQQMELLEHIHAERIRAISLLSGSAVLESLTRFRELRKLDLREIDLETAPFPPPRLLQLEELTVSYDFMGKTALDWIRELPKLRVLYVRSTYRITDLDRIQRHLTGVHVTEEWEMMGGGYAAF
jgi:hypothetical protein